MFNFIADVQSSRDLRDIHINKVGIKDIKHPITIIDGSGKSQSTIANIGMYVNLDAQHKGTHMSRFIEILNSEPTVISLKNIHNFLEKISKTLNSESSYINLEFPFFINKEAPISKVKSLMDYNISLSASREEGKTQTYIQVKVPVTSLCPCSKKISKYGAHNQRSLIIVKVRTDSSLSIENLIETIEHEASCELFALLKRVDEKMVTESAYDNPKFVEDIVRDIAVKLEEIENVKEYSISSENFESIHNHSAYAFLEKNKELID